MTSVMAKPQPQSITPAEQADLERRVTKAKALLILDHPFFGNIASKRAYVYTYDVPTAAIDAKGTIYLNPAWCFPLTVKNLIFLIAHECMHYMLAHSIRRQHRKPVPWNIAGDKVINDILIDAGVGDFIDGGQHEVDARFSAAEKLYDEDEGGDGGDVGGIGADIGDPVDENGNALDESQIHELETQAQIETIQAAKAAKMVGKLPANIERMIDEMVNVPTPWHEILERYMQGKIKDDISWNRPNRRFIGNNIYLPSADYTPRTGHVVVGVDTSGSIGQRELDEFNGHVDKIIESCNPEKVTVIYCDSRVNHVDEFEPDDYPVRLHPHGGGGTSFKPVFDYVDDNDIDPEVVVYLTDGCGDQNEFTTHHDTVWLTTHSTQFNWGTVIKFEGEA